MRDQTTSNREAELTAPTAVGSGDWLGCGLGIKDINKNESKALNNPDAGRCIRRTATDARAADETQMSAARMR